MYRITHKANSHKPYCVHAVPLPCRAALIHTCHAALLALSDRAVSFVEVRVVVGRRRTRAGHPHAVSGRAHNALCRDLEKLLSERHGRGMAGRGMGAA
jgi:hypothetical protein